MGKSSRIVKIVDPLVRFNAKFKVGLTGCWVWVGRPNTSGYGTFSLNKKRERAHRVSWMLNRGPIPEGLQVLHKCDNPPCVNPDHLFLGTNADNVKDRVSKGRTAPNDGETNPKALLTKWLVLKIKRMRKRRMTYKAIGDTFGVSLPAVYKAVHGKTWTK